MYNKWKILLWLVPGPIHSNFVSPLPQMLWESASCLINIQLKRRITRGNLVFSGIKCYTSILIKAVWYCDMNKHTSEIYWESQNMNPNTCVNLKYAKGIYKFVQNMELIYISTDLPLHIKMSIFFKDPIQIETIK